MSRNICQKNSKKFLYQNNKINVIFFPFLLIVNWTIHVFNFSFHKDIIALENWLFFLFACTVFCFGALTMYYWLPTSNVIHWFWFLFDVRFLYAPSRSIQTFAVFIEFFFGKCRNLCISLHLRVCFCHFILIVKYMRHRYWIL